MSPRPPTPTPAALRRAAAAERKALAADLANLAPPPAIEPRLRLVAAEAARRAKPGARP